jgi:hypothetical protein
VGHHRRPVIGASMKKGLLTAWLAEIVLISYRATRSGASEGTASVPFPLPSQYASTFIIYGTLGLLPDQADALAAVVGWGFVVATLLNLWVPVKPGQVGAQVAKPGQATAAGNIAAPSSSASTTGG